MNEKRSQARSVPEHLADGFVLVAHFLLGFLGEQSARLSASGQVHWKHFEHPTSCQKNAQPVSKVNIFHTFSRSVASVWTLSRTEVIPVTAESTLDSISWAMLFTTRLKCDSVSSSS